MSNATPDMTQLTMHIPYRIMLMESLFEDESFIYREPQLVGTYFARQAIALIKVRDLYELLVKKKTLPQMKGLMNNPVNIEQDIQKDDILLLNRLYAAASAIEAHTTPKEDYNYETLELGKGIKILRELLNKHWYIPNGLELSTVMERYRSAQSRRFANKKISA